MEDRSSEQNTESAGTDTKGKIFGLLEKFCAKMRLITSPEAADNGLSVLLRKTLDAASEAERHAVECAWLEYFSGQEKESRARADKQADECIYWASGRAFAIALIPLPLADVGPLVANEAYMIYRIGTCYGYTVDRKIIAGFLGCAGGSIAGRTAAGLLPFLKSPIAAGITYGVGYAAKAYFASGMNLDEKALKEIFEEGKDQAAKINWQEPKTD